MPNLGSPSATLHLWPFASSFGFLTPTGHAHQPGEDTNHELTGTSVVVGGGRSLASSVGGTVEMTLMMPSLSGSSAMSSGVISGFRRALVWADGGGGGGAAAANATCPSVVSRCAATPGNIHTATMLMLPAG